VGGPRVVTGSHALGDCRHTRRSTGGSALHHSFTEKNHACEEKRREKGWPEVDAQVYAKEGRSEGDA
jgi:hypothetical protein